MLRGKPASFVYLTERERRQGDNKFLKNFKDLFILIL